MSVEGKVVLVTGASRGIGAATALRLARAGARVVAGSRNEERLREVAAAANGSRGEVVAVRMDVQRRTDVDLAMGVAMDRFGGLDALVNNAAVGALGRIEEQSENDWEDVFQTNVLGTLRCCQAAIPLLERRGGGTIVNVSSAAANDGFPLLGAYSASKAAIATLSIALRREVKDRKIRVSTIRIHHVLSDFLNAYPAPAVGTAIELWMKEGLLATAPLIEPSHVAEVIEFIVGLERAASVHDIDIRALGA
jgi:NAD(P)-dependent dehydrogenase (short-subunit alcohol dehydrogenase family)